MEGKDDTKKEEATLADLMGVMAAFASPEQGKEIQKQFQQMGEAMGPMFEGLPKEAEALVGYQWVKMETDELPQNALAAGKDQSENYNVYVGRAEVGGEPCVGKVHNHTRYFGSILEGREKRVTSEPFYVLCVDPSADMEWVEYKDGEIPDGVVSGGKLYGSNFYVGRGLVRNQLTPGMVYTDKNKPHQLHALYDGKVNPMTQFKVLVIKPNAKEAIKESSEKQEEEARNEPASLNDIFGMMGGLMAALAPPKDAKAGFDEMSTVLGSIVEGEAKDVVQNSHGIPTKVGKQVYEWVTLDSKKVPENALHAAKDHGNAVYVGRGLLDGSIRLGKYHAKYETLYVSHLGKEKEVYENIEVLCVDKDAEVEWVDCKNGILPSGAIVGTIVDGKSEYVGKGKIGSEISPGRIVPEDKCMYAPYGGKDHVLTECQALVIQCKPVYEWVPLNSKKVPENALLAAKDHGNAVYVGRGLLDGSIRLGKYHAKYETLYVSHLGEEKEVYENIEVLCVDKNAKVEWVDCKNGILPAGAIVGTIVDGRSEYVGKGKTGSEISPGRIVPEDKCMYATYGGKDHMLTECQALVIHNEVLVIKPKAEEALMEKQVKRAREAKNNDEKARTMRDILDDIETIEATIELEEEKFNREIVHKKEMQGKEMEKLKKKLKIKRKELKDGLSLK